MTLLAFNAGRVPRSATAITVANLPHASAADAFSSLPHASATLASSSGRIPDAPAADAVIGHSPFALAALAFLAWVLIAATVNLAEFAPSAAAFAPRQKNHHDPPLPPGVSHSAAIRYQLPFFALATITHLPLATSENLFTQFPSV